MWSYPGRVRVLQEVGEEPSRTKQAFRDECDVNNILSRYRRTGLIDYKNVYSAQYGDIPAMDFQQAQNLVLRARKMYDDLPSTVRREFASPYDFLDFVQNPANGDRMVELGLRNPPPPAVDTGATETET